MIHLKTKYTGTEKKRDMAEFCKVKLTVHKSILYYITLMEECPLTNSMQKEHSREPRMKDRMIRDD